MKLYLKPHGSQDRKKHFQRLQMDPTFPHPAVHPPSSSIRWEPSGKPTVYKYRVRIPLFSVVTIVPAPTIGSGGERVWRCTNKQEVLLRYPCLHGANRPSAHTGRAKGAPPSLCRCTYVRSVVRRLPIRLPKCHCGESLLHTCLAEL
jgi:hypothetical protein